MIIQNMNKVYKMDQFNRSKIPFTRIQMKEITFQLLIQINKIRLKIQTIKTKTHNLIVKVNKESINRMMIQRKEILEVLLLKVNNKIIIILWIGKIEVEINNKMDYQVTMNKMKGYHNWSHKYDVEDEEEEGDGQGDKREVFVGKLLN